MSGGFPLLGALSVGTSVSALQLGAPGASNTKGAFTQVIASSSNDAVALLVNLFPGAAAADRYSFDIAVGGAGSEQIIAPDLFMSKTNITGATGAYGSVQILLPLQVPSGTRISARYQSSGAGPDCYFGAAPVDGGFTQSQAGSIIETLGFSSGTTAGVTVTPGAAAAKGSYSQIIASTSSDYAGFLVGFDASAYTLASTVLIDIAVGAGGSEQIICPNITVRVEVIHSQLMTQFLPIPIPAGSRVSARCSSNTSTTAFGVVLHGVRQ